MIARVIIATGAGAPAHLARELSGMLARVLPGVPILPEEREGGLPRGHAQEGRLHGAFVQDDALPSSSLSTAAWQRRDADLPTFDAGIDAAAERGAFALRVEVEGDGDAASASAEILTRYQRFARRTNAASATRLFARTLEKHRALYDLHKPLVKADFDHAIDAWQWLLRLEPEASAAVQLAALFHDIERLDTEADVRIEHQAASYQAFKDAHAATGARLARALLHHLGWDAATSDRVAALIAHHERPDDDPALALLNDADALSFFSLNSWGFLNYYGLEHTERKVAYTLRRMTPAARRRLHPVRYHPVVERLLREALAEALTRDTLTRELPTPDKTEPPARSTPTEEHV
ncbi:DUF4202 family protein [Chondromyces apiculatus]|uniref:HD domain-containing protein n=1 Tax=Chondromyces apiculatus DSM 436 TaxID=1192034 RepID=A0A017T3S1_9BACT|nr:DUF4202 family protein [Chondromyces apiculatus]EYF03206.1 Hypothetical protein CAP_5710 [Chondromyces apiculatus DSM 436]